MKNIKDAATLLGLLEDGELMSDLSAEIASTMETLRDRAGAKGSAKGSVTLKISFDLEGQSTTIEANLSNRVPPKPRASTFMWSTETGFANEHPRQSNMFEDVNSRERK
jgi:hypothetical protein